MNNSINEIINSQRSYFKSGKTLPVAYRIEMLKALYKEILARDEEIHKALFRDLGKPYAEVISSEITVLLNDIKLLRNNLKNWSQPKRIPSSIINFPSSDWILAEPYGNTLHISPWNYPFQLALGPLVGAVAAGNTVLLKPSENAPHTSQVVAKIIKAVFDPGFVTVVQGGPDVASELLQQRWDYIFFTGGVEIGKIVAKAAAEHLTPTTLELGGKNPCIVDETANIAVSARRIVWGKFFNCGQTCIAPDYILVHHSIHSQFVSALTKEIERAFGKQVDQSNDYGRIINSNHFNRLKTLLDNQNILFGGHSDAETRFLSPTLVTVDNLDSELMRHEIFGPILPIMTYQELEEVHAIIHSFEKPLSFYMFSERKKIAKKMLETHSYGGGAINDTIIQFANPKLPFGGVGHSGMGSYHGKASFDTFTHFKPYVYRPTWLDIPIRYAPYKNKGKLIKRFLKYFQ